MPSRLLLLLLFTCPAIWPCICGPGAWAPICQAYWTAETVFLGTVLDHNHDPMGSGRWTAYLVRVDERFRGVDAHETEIFVDPGTPDCSMSFDIGKHICS